jgi:hypothetical protein
MNKVAAIEKSVRKWEEVEDLIKRKKEFDYFVFWTAENCGYCELFSGDDCCGCSLHERCPEYGVHYCQNHIGLNEKEPLALFVLRNADANLFEEAETKVKVLLDKMRSDLKKAVEEEG